MTSPDQAWSLPVRVDEIPERGRRFDMEPDASMREALARTADVQALLRLRAIFDVTRHGRDGLRVAGTVAATVRQTCVVTLEPLDNEMEEKVDLVFRPGRPIAPADIAALLDAPEGAADAPEPLVDGTVDLGAIATEFLVLGIDPYPRKPDAVFAAPSPANVAANPFVALGALTKEKRTRNS